MLVTVSVAAPSRWGLRSYCHPKINMQAWRLSEKEPAPSLQVRAGTAQGSRLHLEAPGGSAGGWTTPSQALDPFSGSSQSPLGNMAVSASSSSESWKVSFDPAIPLLGFYP